MMIHPNIPDHKPDKIRGKRVSDFLGGSLQALHSGGCCLVDALLFLMSPRSSFFSRPVVILADMLLCGCLLVVAGCGSAGTAVTTITTGTADITETTVPNGATVTSVAATTGTTETVRLHPVMVSGKWGYIDNSGMIKIEPQFDYAYDFSEGLARVDVKGTNDGWKAGYIDASGDMVIEPRFASAEPFSDGMAAVGTVDQGDGGKWGSIDTSGALVVPMHYATPPIFSEGLAAVRDGENRTWSFIDKTGATVLGPYKEAGNFSEGLAYVDWVDGRGYIEKDGDRVIELPGSLTSERWPQEGFSEGLARVTSQEGEVVRYGFIDSSGTVVIEPRFDWAGGFSTGLAVAAVQVGGEVKLGYMDKSGDWVIEPQFYSVSPFSEGLAVVMRLENYAGVNDFETYGYIDKTGTVVIPVQYSEASLFSGGVAAVVFRDAHYGSPNYIDKTGKVIWRAE